MSLRVKLRRLGYRTAFRLLQGYWFIVRPEMDGVKCVIVDRDHVLLVRHTYGSRAWDLPGGGLKRGEAPLAAARREMQEELGLGQAEWQSLGELRGRVNHRRETVHFFTTELAAPRLEIDLGELAEIRWFPIPDLPDDVGPYVDEVMTRLLGPNRATREP
ncbi:MAG: NUDIX domain-containing protein [Solirubrobacteraceae bacterium]